MLCEIFAEAWLSAEHKVLGKTLRPYCPYYHFWLQFLESPFLSNGAVSYIDIERAITICTSDYEAVKFPRNTWLRRTWRTITEPGHEVLQRAANDLTAYLDDYLSPPRFWTPTDSGSGTRMGPMPELLDVVTATMCMIGGGESAERTAWMMPIGRVYWYAAAYKQHHGASLSFETPKDRAIMERIRAMRAKKGVQ